MRTVAPLTLLFFVLSVHAQRSKYEKTIPPEILRRYDPDVVSGKRPKIVTITQAMIFSLRQEPDRGGDYYRLGFEPEELSSAQQEILREWISHGAKVVVWGRNDFNIRVLSAIPQ